MTSLLGPSVLVRLRVPNFGHVSSYHWRLHETESRYTIPIVCSQTLASARGLFVYDSILLVDG